MKYFENIKELLNKYPHLVTDSNREFIRIHFRIHDDPIFGLNIIYVKRLKIYQIEILSKIFKTRGISYKEFLKYSKEAAENGFSFILLNVVADIRERFTHSRYQADEDNIIYLSLARDIEKLDDNIVNELLAFAKRFFRDFIKKYSKEDKRW